MLSQSIITALAASTLLFDGVVGFKSNIGNTARRHQERAAKIVEESRSGNHLHARQMNGTSNSTMPKRFLTNATARKY